MSSPSQELTKDELHLKYYNAFYVRLKLGESDERLRNESDEERVNRLVDDVFKLVQQGDDVLRDTAKEESAQETVDQFYSALDDEVEENAKNQLFNSIEAPVDFVGNVPSLKERISRSVKEYKKLFTRQELDKYTEKFRKSFGLEPKEGLDKIETITLEIKQSTNAEVNERNQKKFEEIYKELGVGLPNLGKPNVKDLGQRVSSLINNLVNFNLFNFYSQTYDKLDIPQITYDQKISASDQVEIFIKGIRDNVNIDDKNLQENFYKLLGALVSDENLLDDVSGSIDRYIKNMDDLDVYLIGLEKQSEDYEKFIVELEKRFEELTSETPQQTDDDTIDNNIDEKKEDIEVLEQLESDLQKRINKLRNEIEKLQREKTDLEVEKNNTIQSLTELIGL